MVFVQLKIARKYFFPYPSIGLGGKIGIARYTFLLLDPTIGLTGKKAREVDLYFERIVSYKNPRNTLGRIVESVER